MEYVIDAICPTSGSTVPAETGLPMGLPILVFSVSVTDKGVISGISFTSMTWIVIVPVSAKSPLSVTVTVIKYAGVDS